MAHVFMPTQVDMKVNAKANSWASENNLRILVVLERMSLLFRSDPDCLDVRLISA